MKKKLPTTKARHAVKASSTAAVKPAENPPQSELPIPASVAPVIVVTEQEAPPPEYLAEIARGLVSRSLLNDYRQTIFILRNDKGYSFREIAEWLTENGVPADYNAVYRLYTKGMGADEIEFVEAREREHEENEDN